MPKDTYFAIAYEYGMFDVDMVRFVGKDCGKIEDLWSTGFWTPEVD